MDQLEPGWLEVVIYDRKAKRRSWQARCEDVDNAYETWGEQGNWNYALSDRTGLGDLMPILHKSQAMVIHASLDNLDRPPTERQAMMFRTLSVTVQEARRGE